MKNKKTTGLLLIAGFLMLLCGTLGAGVLEINELNKNEAEPDYQRHPHGGFKSDVSQQNLLGLQRSGKSLLPETSLSAQAPLTLKMCAVRVQFQDESPDDDSTTGTGQFDFRTYEQFLEEEKHGIDPAPHNREYFEKHIEALNNYWHTVSNGNLTIEGTVFPADSDSVYTLEHTMGYYGSQSPEFGLGELFYDALRLADRDDDINWIEYDVFVIFHAGSDRQNDLGFPPTPHDLFTGFIIMGEPVPVEDSTILIMEGMIMPETASQDNRATALNAVMAHEFGHQLGLVDLYDTHRFNTFVGDFSLMDNNGFGTGVDLGFELTRTILGTIPLYPEAWSRAYLGFNDVVVVEEGINLDVMAAELASNTSKIYKVPISENEYFLIENRQIDPDRDGGASLKADLDGTGVILGPAPNPDVVPPGQPAPLTREYDFLMPGSGMVIWHVDESVAWLDYDNDGLNNFYDNDLQWYYIEGFDDQFEPWENRPFLRLIEADGIIDFGGEYWTNFGRAEDMFEANRNDHFGPNTNPSTRSNSIAYTGIDIADISGNDTIMYFDLDQEVKTAGWPHHTDSSHFPPVLYDIDHDGIDEVFVSGKNYLLGFKADGDFIIPPVPGAEVISERRSTPRGPLNEITYIDTLRVLGAMGAVRRITTAPTVFDLDNDGIAEVAVGTEFGEVYLYKMQDLDNNGLADRVVVNDLSNFAVSTSIVVAEADANSDGYELLVGTSDGGFYILSSAGETLSQTIAFNNIQQFSISEDFNHAFALNYLEEAEQKNYFIHDLKNPSVFVSVPGEVAGFTSGIVDTTSNVRVVALTSEGHMYTFESDGERFRDYMDNNPINLGHTVGSAPVMYPSFTESFRSQVIFTGENEVYAYDLNGAPVRNFPQTADIHRPAGTITSTPIVVDVSGDGRKEILFGTPDGEIFLMTEDGSRIVNSPIAAPLSVTTSLAFSTAAPNLNNRGNLYAVTGDGLIYSFTLPYIESDEIEPYLQFGGGSHHQNFQRKTIQSVDTGEGLLAQCYNYPNPAREFTRIRFELSDDAEANIRIYDLAGRLVYEDNMQALGGAANEYTWELDNFPSGVYHCRLEVNGAGSSDVQLWNIAVVK